MVYAPWQGAGRALFNHAVDLAESLLGSCAPPGRIGWYRPSPVVSPPANILSPSRDRCCRLQTFQDFYSASSHGGGYVLSGEPDFRASYLKIKSSKSFW
jgi:hypothetical protein